MKEDMTQLELAVWKAKLDENDDDSFHFHGRADAIDAGKEKRIMSGASILSRERPAFSHVGMIRRLQRLQHEGT
jgi:hypothetical protein